MRDDLEVLLCDTDGCDQEISGPSVLLRERAEEAGWQVNAVTALYLSDDGPELDQEDHCPGHHVDAMEREEVLRRAGGPGGIQPWHLNQ